MGPTHLLQLAAADVDVEVVAHVAHRAAAHEAPAVDEVGGHEVLAAAGQGLTLVHFSAQLKRILWDRGALRGCSGGVLEVSGGMKGYQGVFRVYLCQTRLRLSLEVDECMSLPQICSACAAPPHCAWPVTRVRFRA